MLRGAGDTTVPMLLAAAGYWGVGMVAAVGLGFATDFGPVGVWIGLCAGLGAVALTLLNADQPQVNENGSGAGDTDSNQRCPNGSGGARNTTTYLQFAPTVGAGNVCEVAPPPGPAARKIHEIQGSGPASPFDGTGAIVQAVVQLILS